jgi:hypothetical protein
MLFNRNNFMLVITLTNKEISGTFTSCEINTFTHAMTVNSGG